jgi:ferredoxin
LIRPSHKVRVVPHGIELDVKDGQTIFRVAYDCGLEWPTRCGGAKNCTLCTVIVVDGQENLSKPDEEETFRLRPLYRRLELEPAQLRMACSARVRGPVVVQPRYPFGRVAENDDDPVPVEC